MVNLKGREVFTKHLLNNSVTKGEDTNYLVDFIVLCNY